MSSPADTDLAEGFTVLLEQHGEAVTFRGASVTVVIDRAPGAEADDDRKPDFSDRQRSVIAVRRSDLSAPPRSGESWVDGLGHSHRAEKVEPRGDLFYINCKVISP